MPDWGYVGKVCVAVVAGFVAGMLEPSPPKGPGPDLPGVPEPDGYGFQNFVFISVLRLLGVPKERVDFIQSELD